MARFALLEHDTRNAAGVPPAERGLHWDLLVEVQGQERIPTWRLSDDPLAGHDAVPAQRISDHRPLYLEFEGLVSGDRGIVRRIDDGEAKVRTLAGDTLVVRLEGQRLRGWFEVAGLPDGKAVFRRCRGSEGDEFSASGPRPEADSGI